MQAEGYDLKKLIKRVAEIMAMRYEDVIDSERDRKRIQSRSILCFWATDQLGVSQTQLGQILNLTQPAISHAVRRGKTIAESKSYVIFDN